VELRYLRLCVQLRTLLLLVMTLVIALCHESDVPPFLFSYFHKPVTAYMLTDTLTDLVPFNKSLLYPERSVILAPMDSF
jgi:hypothetical protein